jgi:hypothetical protein
VRKVKPEAVFDDFAERLSELRTLWLEAAIKLGKKMEAQMAELTVLAAVVQWDEFISKIHVALVNRDTRRFRAYLGEKVIKYVEEKFGKPTVGWVSVKLPDHPSKEETEQLLDRRGYLPAYDSKELIKRARQRFVDDVAKRFELKPGEVAALEAWRALRDFVAHRSSASLITLNQALAAKELPATMRKPGKKQLRSAGAFLRSTPKDGEMPRLLYYLNEMKRLAVQFSGVQVVGEPPEIEF